MDVVTNSAGTIECPHAEKKERKGTQTQTLHLSQKLINFTKIVEQEVLSLAPAPHQPKEIPFYQPFTDEDNFRRAWIPG